MWNYNYTNIFLLSSTFLSQLIAMGEEIKKEIRKQIGANLKKLIDEKQSDAALRDLDAISGKDFSWLAKIFRGDQNLTIDSLSEIMIQFKIQPKDVFNFDVSYPAEN